MSRRSSAARVTAGVAVGVSCAAAHAQEAMYTEAATMPGPGTVVVRQMLHVVQYGRSGEGVEPGDERTRQVESLTSAQVGLVRDWSLRLQVPVTWRETRRQDGESESDRGVEDLELMFKWRVVQEDTGGIDTFRVALLGGASVASGDDKDFSSQSVNPFVGAAATLIRGRHGVNADVMYRVQTGGDERHNFGGMSEADLFTLSGSHVFRLWPERFTASSSGGWYVTSELMSLWETSGDREVRAGFGVMWEAWRVAVEGGVLLPVWNDVRQRPELDWGVGVGVRFTF